MEVGFGRVFIKKKGGGGVNGGDIRIIANKSSDYF